MDTPSRFFARATIFLMTVALLFFFFPIFGMFTGYVEGLGLFFVLYLFTAFAATVTAIIASRRQQWSTRGQGGTLIAILYGLPLLLVLGFVGLMFLFRKH